MTAIRMTKPWTALKSLIVSAFQAYWPMPGPREDLLDDDVPGDQVAEDDADHGQDRDEGVAQPVAHDDASSGTPMALAVRTKSELSVSSIEPRVILTIGALTTKASTSAGSHRWFSASTKVCELAGQQAVDGEQAGHQRRFGHPDRQAVERRRRPTQRVVEDVHHSSASQNSAWAAPSVAYRRTP